MRKFLFTAALLAGFAVPAVTLPTAASAEERAIVTADLNVRVGPDTGYARIATIPRGDDVIVFGCVSGYLWCDILWNGLRGWVYSDFLAFFRDNRRYEWRAYAPRFDFPIISFSFGDYHDRWYRDRPWHRSRNWNNDWNRNWDRDHGRSWSRDRDDRPRVRRNDDDDDRRRSTVRVPQHNQQNDDDDDGGRRGRDGSRGSHGGAVKSPPSHLNSQGKTPY